MFLLGSADFVRRGLADGFADGRTGHAVLRGGDPVRQRLSRHVTEEEEEEVVVEEVVVEEVMVVEVVGAPIKMSLAAAAAAAAGRTRRRRRRRVVPSARMGRLSRSKRRRWWRRRRRRRTAAAAAAAHTGEDPVGEFMRRANNQTKRRSHPKFTRWRKKERKKKPSRPRYRDTVFSE